MNINGLKSYQQIQSIVPDQNGQKIDSVVNNDSKVGFNEFLKDAIGDVNSLQNQAEAQIEGLVTRTPGFTSHEAMITLEKADIAFQLMNSVRSKIVRAYEEVLRTQV